jgi:acyl-CoA thioesterase FadM
VPLRFEDLSQDGRLILEVFPNALGAAVWEPLLAKDPVARAARKQGVIPILTRFVMQGTQGPFALMREPVRAWGTFALAHGVAAGTEQVDRVYVNMWAELRAPIGRTYGPKPDRAGEMDVAGRVFAEHVLTRPFAPAAERRVLRLDIPGEPPVPAVRYDAKPAAAVLELPAGATPIDDALVADETPIVFGLVHTDSNHHVNSLVYLRVFEEAALRRLAALGKDVRVLSRELEIVYRKPCFAGERMRVALRAFTQGSRVGVSAVLVSDEEAKSPELLAAARPRTYVQIIFEP